MKTLAAIKNDLFKDYLKIVSTDNLEQTLDNPAVPVPFICVASVENTNADTLAIEINKFFNHKKIKNKEFLAINEDELAQLHFLFNLINVSGGNKSESTPVIDVKSIVKEVKITEPIHPVVVEEKVVIEVPVETDYDDEALVVESTPIVEEVIPVLISQNIEDNVVPQEAVEVESFSDTIEELENAEIIIDTNTLIESLGIPVNSIINFIKKPEITAILLDEKTIILDSETLSIVDGTKKAFKKAGVTGMALGLANWNYEGTSLKSLKDKN